MARFFREKFDRTRDFVVARAFTFGGQGFVSGQAIDKALFNERRLRQLYEMRHIEYGKPKPVPQVAARPKVERHRLRPRVDRRLDRRQLAVAE